jgi:signal transduction histidine kinase
VPYDLLGAVASAAAAYTATSERHEIRVQVGHVPLQALGDPTDVSHVVGQLVENAVKYSPLGGAVEVSVRRDGQFAVVEVSDEGIGLPAGEEMSLFAPFFQAGSTNTREFGGVGLGLYIVRQLVEAQGGAVLARNRKDVGAVVGFSVPLAVEPPAPRDGAEPATRTPLLDAPPRLGSRRPPP